jgi:hypothetical protein
MKCLVSYLIFIAIVFCYHFVLEREGSRVRIELEGECWRCHRPHPGKEAKRYQVEEAREFLERVGVLP